MITVEEAGARLVSTTIFVPSVVSQFDLELTAQGQFHVLDVELKYTKSCQQSITKVENTPPVKSGSGSSIQFTES